MSLDWTTVTTDKLAGMATIVKKSPVFRLWKSGNRTLTLSTPWMQALLGTIVCNFGGNPAICLVEEAICAKCLQTDGRTDRQTDGRTTDTARLH